MNFYGSTAILSFGLSLLFVLLSVGTSKTSQKYDLFQVIIGTALIALVPFCLIVGARELWRLW
jgi:hypothetical protein